MKPHWIHYLFLMPLAVLLTAGPGTPALAQSDSLRYAVEGVARKVGPAVVSIRTEEVKYYRGYYSGSQDLFDQFFNDFLGRSPLYAQRRLGLGSGVIIDPRGYILTNAHVVAGADRLTVMLPDGRTFSGDLKGIDPRSDLAVVKIDAKDIPVAPVGDSDGLKIGQWAVAIGNPFGNLLNDPQPTVTTGVVSALHRALPGRALQDTDYSDLIQTDAAINPGNSGGPLVDLDGKIIGINVAIFSTSGGYQGIGFAVPVNYAKAIVDQIIKGRPLEQGWIGVAVQNLNARLAQYFQLPSTDGVLILRVAQGSPADKAGLKGGDIILAINDVRMRTSALLMKYLANTGVGKKLTLKVWRDDREVTVPVTVEKREDLSPEPGQTGAGTERSPAAQPAWRGLTVREMSGDTAGFISGETLPGVLIDDVRPDSPADTAGLRPGDRIIAVNNKPLTGVKDFAALIQNLTGNCLVQTQRGFFVIGE